MDTQPRTLADLPSDRRVPLFPILCVIAAVAFKGFQYLLSSAPGVVREFPVDRTIIAVFYVLLAVAYFVAPKRSRLFGTILLISVHVVPVWFLLRPLVANGLLFEYVLGYFTIYVGVLYFIVSPKHIVAFTGVQVVAWLATVFLQSDGVQSVQGHLLSAVLVLIAALTYILRRSEQSLRTRLAEEGQYFKALFSESPDAQLILQDDTIVDHNDELHRFLPDGTECTGRSIIELFADVRSDFDPECASSFQAFIETPAEAGENRFACDLGFQVAPGIVLCGDVLVKRLPLSPKRFLVTIRDTTERRKAVQRTEAAAREREEFLSTMSHEIRTPLGGIIGLVRLLKNEREDQEQREKDFETLATTSQVLMDLVNGVLDLSKLSSGTVALEPEVVHLSSIVETVVESFAPAAAEKRITVTTELDLPTDRYIIADRGRLLQVLANLLSNAVKVTVAGGVTVSARELSTSGNMAVMRIAVRDTGPGIPEENRLAIFDEYHHNSTSGESGTGLGLSIVQKILALYGSTAHVDSKVGKGSTFWFDITLPIAVTPEKPATEPPAKLPLSVAIVEDDRVNRLVLQRTLEQRGATVREYESGDDALEQLESTPVDAFVLDLQLPGIDGLEVARRIRRSPQGKWLPIALLSAGIGSDTRHEATRAGIDVCLSKPFDDDALVAALSLGKQTEARR